MKIGRWALKKAKWSEDPRDLTITPLSTGRQPGFALTPQSARPMTSAMPTPLQLPNEILSLITCELNLRSLLDLRLASRHLNGLALLAISKRRFETCYVMLQQHSIENIVEISPHCVFVPALRTLAICINHLTPSCSMVAGLYQSPAPVGACPSLTPTSKPEWPSRQNPAAAGRVGGERGRGAVCGMS